MGAGLKLISGFTVIVGISMLVGAIGMNAIGATGNGVPFIGIMGLVYLIAGTIGWIKN